MKPYNYGMASAAFLEPGDTVIVNNLLATVKSKVGGEHGFTLVFEVEQLGDERVDGFPVTRETIAEAVTPGHEYPFIFFVSEKMVVR